MFATWTTSGFPPEEWVVGQTVCSWQQMWWMDDQTKFEDASLETLRTHHSSWLAAQDPKIRQMTFPEHYMFLVVDHQVLQNIQYQNPEKEHLDRDEPPYVRAYDADSSIEDSSYPGWIKVELTSFYALYYEGMKHESMRGLRSRYSEWFDEDVLEEETYLAEESPEKIEDKELYDKVCDASCGDSLRCYFEDVSQACAGYKITGAPPTMYGGYMWEAWNETCYIEPQSGRYCNEIIDGFTEVEHVYDMPQNELCSYCNTKVYQMRQASQYSAYDAIHDPDCIEHINKRCNLHIPAEAPPPLTPQKAPEEPFCRSGIYHTIQEGDTCVSIAKTYSVASNALSNGNRDKIGRCDIMPPGVKLCIPPPCDIYELQPEDICLSIEIEQRIRWPLNLRTYNPWISWDCSNLEFGLNFDGGILCISPQGGKVTGIYKVLLGNVIPSRAIGYTEDAHPPPPRANLAVGTNRNCGRWHRVEEGETCAMICIQEQINIDLLVAVNTALDRYNCSSRLVVNTTICVNPRVTWEDEEVLPDDYWSDSYIDEQELMGNWSARTTHTLALVK